MPEGGVHIEGAVRLTPSASSNTGAAPSLSTVSTMNPHLAVFVIGFGVIAMALVSIAVGDPRPASPKHAFGKREPEETTP